MEIDRGLTIAEMATTTGLSTETLRWYEREGVVPRVPRTASGHRRYFKRDQSLLLLLVALRDAGMTVDDMKQFVALLSEGAASHGRRIDLLEQTQRHLEARRQQLEHASQALTDKIAHYEHLIALGLDCDGAPVPESLREVQAARA